MSPTSTISSSVTTFVHGIFGIVMSIFQAIWGVVQSVLVLAQSTTQLGLDVFRGVAGFVTANFLLIAVLGGVYYFYRNRGKGANRKRI